MSEIDVTGVPQGRGLGIRYERLEARVALLEVTAPGYQEFFFCVSGRDTVTVTAFDPSDASWDQPRIYHLPRPSDWLSDTSAEDLLLQIWRLTGHSR